jgi:hypothetical protein
MKVILYAGTPGDRQLALRAAEHLIKHPEKRDTIITFPDAVPVKDFFAYRTKTGNVVARQAANEEPDALALGAAVRRAGLVGL